MRIRGITGALALALGVLFAVAGSASAQPSSRLSRGDGMDLHLFRPAIDSKGHFSVNGTDVMPHLHFSLGLVLDAGGNLLPFHGFDFSRTAETPDENRLGHVVDIAATGTLQFSLGLANWAVVGLQLPIAVAKGENIQIPGYYNDVGTPVGLDGQGIGDLTIHGKVRLLRAERDPIGLAAVLRMQIPTGDSRRFLGESGFTLWPSVVAEYRPHRKVRFGLEVGYRFNAGTGSPFPIDGRTCPSGSTFAPMMGCNPAGLDANSADLVDAGTELRYNDLLTFGFAASFRIARTVDLTLETYGSQIAQDFGTNGAFNMEAIGGLKIFVQHSSYLLLAGGAGLRTGGFQTPDWRAVFGIVFEPSIGDRDGDGILDDVDQCPDEPEDYDDFEDSDGCPDPDNDRDGILDDDDDCPLIPEDRDGDEDEDGCPEGNTGDRDGDGILDEVDECPDDPEDRDNFEDEDGCPDPDNDRDGILDVEDLCPNDPEDRDNFEDENGCPDPDNDHDRILDADDECPNDPETYNGHEDEDGCPDQGSVIIEENQLLILEKIYFATDSAVILSRSFAILDAVAATLNGNPQITLIEVQGHADERGDDEYNVRLTRDRAASVVEAMVQRGVARQRVRSAGYGERCPVDPRSNRAAWERNRRVEFKIISTSDGPTGVEVACPAGQEFVPR